MLKRLEIRSTKSKIGVTDLTWVNEEVKDIEKEDEKSLVVNEIALMIPYLNRLESSVADPDPDPNPNPSDPYVFGPPGSETGSISKRYGSGPGSSYHKE